MGLDRPGEGRPVALADNLQGAAVDPVGDTERAQDRAHVAGRNVEPIAVLGIGFVSQTEGLRVRGRIKPASFAAGPEDAGHAPQNPQRLNTSRPTIEFQPAVLQEPPFGKMEGLQMGRAQADLRPGFAVVLPIGDLRRRRAVAPIVFATQEGRAIQGSAAKGDLKTVALAGHRDAGQGRVVDDQLRQIETGHLFAGGIQGDRPPGPQGLGIDRQVVEGAHHVVFDLGNETGGPGAAGRLIPVQERQRRPSRGQIEADRHAPLLPAVQARGDLGRNRPLQIRREIQAEGRAPGIVQIGHLSFNQGPRAGIGRKGFGPVQGHRYRRQLHVAGDVQLLVIGLQRQDTLRCGLAEHEVADRDVVHLGLRGESDVIETQFLDQRELQSDPAGGPASRIGRREAQASDQLEPIVIEQLERAVEGPVHRQVDVDGLAAGVETANLHRGTLGLERAQSPAGDIEVHAGLIVGRPAPDSGHRRHGPKKMDLYALVVVPPFKLAHSGLGEHAAGYVQGDPQHALGRPAADDVFQHPLAPILGQGLRPVERQIAVSHAGCAGLHLHRQVTVHGIHGSGDQDAGTRPVFGPQLQGRGLQGQAIGGAGVGTLDLDSGERARLVEQSGDGQLSGSAGQIETHRRDRPVGLQRHGDIAAQGNPKALQVAQFRRCGGQGIGAQIRERGRQIDHLGLLIVEKGQIQPGGPIAQGKIQLDVAGQARRSTLDFDVGRRRDPGRPEPPIDEGQLSADNAHPIQKGDRLGRVGLGQQLPQDRGQETRQIRLRARRRARHRPIGLARWVAPADFDSAIDPAHQVDPGADHFDGGGRDRALNQGAQAERHRHPRHHGQGIAITVADRHLAGAKLDDPSFLGPGKNRVTHFQGQAGLQVLQRRLEQRCEERQLHRSGRQAPDRHADEYGHHGQQAQYHFQGDARAAPDHGIHLFAWDLT